MTARRLVVTTACALLLGGVVTTPAASTASTSATDRSPAGAAAAIPDLEVSTVQDGLAIPWDLTFLPSGAFLYTQRRLLTVRLHRTDGTEVSVAIDNSSMWSSGETGLMSIVASPTFGTDRLFWTCQGADAAAGEHQVQVTLWRLGPQARAAERVRNIVNGLPSTSGRHGGCRLRFGSEGALYVGTGDAATTANPQSLTSGGGKVLRVRPLSGRGWPDNRFADAANVMKQRILTYGHRNVQGLALRSNGAMWSVEQGTYRDDEVNRLQVGGNYGWRPGPGYDESPPMTNFLLPGKQFGARWSSGDPTIATSGAAWLEGAQWGDWDGALAVATLKDTSLRIMKFSPSGVFQEIWTPPALDAGDRLRTPVLGPDGNLYVTTSNGSDDRILEVVPLLP